MNRLFFLLFSVIFAQTACVAGPDQFLRTGVLINRQGNDFQYCLAGGKGLTCETLSIDQYAFEIDLMIPDAYLHLKDIENCSFYKTDKVSVICVGGHINSMIYFGNEMSRDFSFVMSVEGSYPWQDFEQIIRPKNIYYCIYLMDHQNLIDAFDLNRRISETHPTYLKALCGPYTEAH
jgi:hypothetical protein